MASEPQPLGPKSDSKAFTFFAHQSFSRADWANLRFDTPMTLSATDVEELSGLTERMSVNEVVDIYLPLSRLLNLHVAAAQELHTVTSRFLGQSNRRVPFIIGLAGSVAVGKSTTGRVLQALLARWPHHPRVDVVPTDGFLLPNKVLEERNLMNRKGFPESYNVKEILRFLADVKAGRPCVKAPVYSHLFYDIMEGETISVDRPDILIVEGLNVLQPAKLPTAGAASSFVSDYFDFSLFLDADWDEIQRWYVERFMRLRKTAFQDPRSYFHRYASLSEEDARAKALHIWQSINLRNLRENIHPTRRRAHLILRKQGDHSVQRIDLRTH